MTREEAEALCARNAAEHPDRKVAQWLTQEQPDGTWTVLALGPTRAACFAGRESGDGCWSFATTYDRELVVECALGLLARMAPL